MVWPTRCGQQSLLQSQIAVSLKSGRICHVQFFRIQTADARRECSAAVRRARHHDEILFHGAIPLMLGRDHTQTWPILRAMKVRHVAVALHADTIEHMLGETVACGRPFCSGWEDNGLINDRVPRIGARHGPCARRFRLEPQQAPAAQASQGMLVSHARAADGKGARAVCGTPVHLGFDIKIIAPGRQHGRTCRTFQIGRPARSCTASRVSHPRCDLL